MLTHPRRRFRRGKTERGCEVVGFEDATDASCCSHEADEEGCHLGDSGEDVLDLHFGVLATGQGG